MNSARRFIRASIVSAPLVLALSCCPKVYKPASDSTPPTIAWKVTNLYTNAVQTFTGSDSFTIKLDEAYQVKMTAEDSGGVNEASLDHSIYWSCTNSNVIEFYPGSDPAITKHDMWPSGQVCSKIVMPLREVNTFTLIAVCKSDIEPFGSEFSGGLHLMTGVAKNFYGGVTTAKLKINITP
jgi:hypothetical protein